MKSTCHVTTQRSPFFKSPELIEAFQIQVFLAIKVNAEVENSLQFGKNFTNCHLETSSNQSFFKLMFIWKSKMGYAQVVPDEKVASVSGLYLDSEYYLHYPPGMKMTDGIPDDVMQVIDKHWSQVNFQRQIEKLLNYNYSDSDINPIINELFEQILEYLFPDCKFIHII